MKLEIGKTYQNGWGVNVKIVSQDPENPSAFRGVAIVEDDDKDFSDFKIIYKEDGEFVPFHSSRCLADREKYNLVISDDHLS